MPRLHENVVSGRYEGVKRFFVHVVSSISAARNFQVATRKNWVI